MMIAKSILILSALCWSWVSIAQSPQSPATPIPAGSATITDLKGDVMVVPAQGASTPARKSEIIGPNTTIETRKGSALLILSEGSQVLVNPNSRVILRLPQEANGNFLEQLIGKIVAKVKKRVADEPPFQMGTPSAVITVRGTHFLVEVTRKKQTYVQVYEGLVQVNGFGRGRPVFVQPGYTTQIGMNSAPEAPRNSSGEFASENSDSRIPGRTSQSDSEGRTTRPTPSPGGHEPPD